MTRSQTVQVPRQKCGWPSFMQHIQSSTMSLALYCFGRPWIYCRLTLSQCIQTSHLGSYCILCLKAVMTHHGCAMLVILHWLSQCQSTAFVFAADGSHIKPSVSFTYFMSQQCCCIASLNSQTAAAYLTQLIADSPPALASTTAAGSHAVVCTSSQVPPKLQDHPCMSSRSACHRRTLF